MVRRVAQQVIDDISLITAEFPQPAIQQAMIERYLDLRIRRNAEIIEDV